MDTTHSSLVRDVERYITQYITFPEQDKDQALVVALWVIATHFHLSFDCFGYLSITAPVKRAGKTRLMEVCQPIAQNGRLETASTASAMYRLIGELAPTYFIDEAERLSSDSLTLMRMILNNGYRRGGMVSRATGEGSQDFPVYGPKAFTAIGDLNDTLRDRSIVITLVRGQPSRRFLYDVNQQEGGALRERIVAWRDQHNAAVKDAYANFAGLTFLTDRDEEIWIPLFVMCDLMDPTQRTRLERAATDLCGLKTAPRVRYASLAGAEEAAEETEYAERLVRDVLTVIDGKPFLYTADVMKRLYEAPTAPWLVFRGVGLTEKDLATMLGRFGVRPSLIRTGSSRNPASKVARGYRRRDVSAAVAKL